jgi:hypothetical protein
VDPENVDDVIARLEAALVDGDPRFRRRLRRLGRRLRQADRRSCGPHPGGARAVVWSLALLSGSGVAVSAWYEAYRRAPFVR